MPRVKLTLPAVLAQSRDEREMSMEAETLAELIEKLSEKRPDLAGKLITNGQLSRRFNIYINGKNASFLGGLQAKLSEGDEVTILPAVTGGMGVELSPDEIERYSRQIILTEIGLEGQERLKSSRVAVVGLGGLGSPIAMTLTAMGVGHLRLIDRDVVEKSNLHRQYLYGPGDVGYPKVEVAVERLSRLNPYVEFEAMPLYVDESTARDIVRGVDVVVDGLDSIAARKAINKACVEEGVPYVFTSAIQVYGMASTIIPGETACLECIFPHLTDDELPTCAVVGVHPAILQFMSGIAVYEAVSLLVGGQPNLKGKLLMSDLKNLSLSTVDVMRVEECPVCGVGAGERVEKRYPYVEEICGREGKATYIVNPGRRLDIPIERLDWKALDPSSTIIAGGKLGATIKLPGDRKISILKTGITVIEGARSSEEALDIYRRITALVEKATAKQATG